MGLLSQDQWSALGLLGQGIADRDFTGGAVKAMGLLDGSKERAMKAQYMQAQIAEAEAQVQERQAKLKRDQEAAVIRQKIPGLFQPPGMAGGEAAPQTMGGIPMFSLPMGTTPMRPTPGGFNVQEALRLGMDPDTIQKYAGLQNVGRQKVARTVKGMGPDGKEYEYQVDEYGQRVGDGMPQFKSPHYQDLGGQVGVFDGYGNPQRALPKSMTPDGRASNSLGWANFNLSREKFNLDQNNAVSDSGGPSQVGFTRQFGKAPPGYRWKADGSQEAIPGGQADLKAGELGAKAKARQDSGIAQADSVLSEVRDAKGLVGWNTSGLGGLTQFVPATEGRNLAAKLQTIKANLGFDRLQQMRDQSPTGGALGQVAVQELAALQATVASLDQLQGSAQLGTALDKIERHYTNWRNTMEQARSGSGGASGGWEIREKR